MRNIIVTDKEGNGRAEPIGLSAEEALKNMGAPDPERICVGAKVNNVICSLSFKLEVNSVVEPVYLDSPEGSRIYRDSFCFLLYMSAKEVFPDRQLIIGNAIGDSYIFYFENIDDVSAEDLNLLEKKIKEKVKRDIPIRQFSTSYKDAEILFKEQNIKGASLLLKYSNEPVIRITTCEKYSDLAHNPLIPSTGYLKHFKLMCYHNGFLIRFPKIGTVDNIPPFKDIPVLFSIFKEYRSRGRIQNFSNVGELNAHIMNNNIKNIILMGDMLHNKKIGEIAEEINKRRESVKVVLIAGPSSSGKTTFIKKLSTQLQIAGFNTVSISLDNYYIPRLETPKDENGNYNFECIEAIDIELLNKDLLNFFKHKEIELPYYNFKTGLREYKNNKIKNSDSTILLIEGIHGLSDKLTYRIKKEYKYKIYISALTQMNLDDHNRIQTTDNRLIRRIVRDYQFRGYDAAETISRWPSVRRGEDKNIFPFQNNADYAFNSALDYELSVLKTFAEPLLKSVKPYQPEYTEARRLQNFLENFLNIQPIYVPSNSILREFIGNSIYKY